MKHLFFAIIPLFFAHVFAQDVNYVIYKQKCEKAYELAFDSSNYQKSLIVLDEINLKTPLLAEEYMLKSYCYKNLGDNKKCADNLKLAWSKRFLDFNSIMPSGIPQLNPTSLMEGFSEEEIKTVEQGYELFSQRKTELSDSLTSVLNELFNKDQEIRDTYWAIKEANGNNSEKTKEAFKAMENVDIENQKVLKLIICKYGFPGNWICLGCTGSANILLLHASTEKFYEEMYDILHKELIKGHISPSDFALWEDRYMRDYKKISLYGLPSGSNETETTHLSKEKMIKNRLQIGLTKYYPWQ